MSALLKLKSIMASLVMPKDHYKVIIPNQPVPSEQLTLGELQEIANMPVLLGLNKIKYPPGTKLAARHNSDITVVITEVSSWHGYNSVIWDKKGVHLSFSPQYSYDYLDGEVSGHCSEASITNQFEVIGFMENYQRPIKEPMCLCPITAEADWVLCTLWDEDSALDFDVSYGTMEMLDELDFAKRGFFGGWELTEKGKAYLWRTTTTD